MKILHIITDLDDGGAEAVLYRLVCQLPNVGHVVISLRDKGKYGELLEQKGVEVYALNLRPSRISVAAILRLRRLISHISPDAVQTWMYHADLIGGLVARAAGVRRVFWGIHNSDLVFSKSNKLTWLISRANALLSYFIPTKIICCALKTVEIHRALGYRAGALQLIQNGYNLDVFKPDLSKRNAVRTRFSIDDSTVLLGMVARFDPMKDHETLILALAHLVKNGYAFRCLLVGAGCETSNSVLVSLIEANGLEDHVILAGRRGDVPEIMNALDIHLLSSIKEAFPNVICESMACGTPCVSTDVGDVAEVVGDTGWICTPRNPTEFGETVGLAMTALRDKSSWADRQQRCRERIQNGFSVNSMASGYLRAWTNRAAV